MTRRMFSDEITQSDAFLDMPSEAQNLYFHLGMNADDDGFISNPKMIQRVVNASSDSLKILLAKKFLILFESGVCVVKHWRINNFIRKDIYKETKYIKEKETLFIRENGSYTQNPENAYFVPHGHFTLEDKAKFTLTSRQQDVNLGKVRLGKDRLGKTSLLEESLQVNPTGKDMGWNDKGEDYEEGVIDADGDGSLSDIKIKVPKKISTRKSTPEILAIFELFGPDCFKRIGIRKQEMEASIFLSENHSIENLKEVMSYLEENRDDSFLPEILSPYDLRMKWAKIKAHKEKHG